MPGDSSRPSHYYIDEKWDAAVDTTLRRVVYGSLVGGVAALMLFRKLFSPFACYIRHNGALMLATKI